MKQNFPDYDRISELRQELDRALWYDDEDATYDKLQKELDELTLGGGVAVDKSCQDKLCNKRRYSPVVVYYPGKVHHLDGDMNNNVLGNLAMVCPKCQSHILLSRFSPQDIWLLKARGLNNAQIGKILGISRERVRQLLNQSRSFQEGAEISELARIAQIKERTKEEENKLEVSLDELVERAQSVEKSLPGRYGHYHDQFGDHIPIIKRRLTDKRTLRKRILAELVKLRTDQTEGGQNERSHNKEG
ncbi:sigma factor-like helix-turn-helix DNA-binding protein [Chloroflexota bacterium]